MVLDPSGIWIENSVEFEASQPADAEQALDPLPPPVPVEVLNVSYFEETDEQSENSDSRQDKPRERSGETCPELRPGTSRVAEKPAKQVEF